MRKSLEETWLFLESKGANMPRTPTGAPHLPDRMPRYDDSSPVNMTFFRTMWTGADLSELTLPKSNIARSGFERVDFQGTDLADSRICWNDFIECDFSNADLRRCDMRASRFDRCLFRDSVLSAADLRRSAFDACIFEGAKLVGTIAHRPLANDDLVPLLSKAQRAQVHWALELGPEPPGG